MIIIPIINTLFNDGLNSSGSVSRYKRATGGPPIAAINPNIPEKVPAIKELGRHTEDGEILKLIEEALD